MLDEQREFRSETRCLSKSMQYTTSEKTIEDKSCT